MPYIKPERRPHYNDLISKLFEEFNHQGLKAGDANYIFTKFINAWFDLSPQYQTVNDIVGMLESAKAEFQRRVVSKLEDEKIVENGDV